MGGSVPAQVTWMNGVVAEFHKEFPQYAKTQVKVDWIPWGDRTTDWNNALSVRQEHPRHHRARQHRHAHRGRERHPRPAQQPT